MAHRVLVVVTAADQARANAAAVQLSGQAADAQTFTNGLSPTGAAPASHYWASVVMDDAHYQTLMTVFVPLFPAAFVQQWDIDANPNYPNTALAGLGLQVVLPSGAV